MVDIMVKMFHLLLGHNIGLMARLGLIMVSFQIFYINIGFIGCIIYPLLYVIFF